jgi:high-affinity iron transporter
MGQTFIVTLREGIEAFLIVAITLAYLRKTGRRSLAPAVYWGTGVAAAVSVGAAVAFAEAVRTPLWEGVLAAAAALMVISMVIYMARASRHLRHDIARRVDAAAAQTRWVGLASVFAFTLLMIVREGMETALLIVSLAAQIRAAPMMAGALLGTAGAAALAWAWSRYGHRVNLHLFFQATAIFLGLFIVQLLIYSFHEFTEAGVLPIDNAYWHVASEPYGPEGAYGQWLSYSLALVPALWLIWVGIAQRGHGPASAAGARSRGS